MKQICSKKEDLRHRLGDLESWSVNRGYRADSIRREMESVNSIYRQVLLQQCPKI